MQLLLFTYYSAYCLGGCWSSKPEHLTPACMPLVACVFDVYMYTCTSQSNARGLGGASGNAVRGTVNTHCKLLAWPRITWCVRHCLVHRCPSSARYTSQLRHLIIDRHVFSDAVFFGLLEQRIHPTYHKKATSQRCARASTMTLEIDCTTRTKQKSTLSVDTLYRTRVRMLGPTLVPSDNSIVRTVIVTRKL